MRDSRILFRRSVFRLVVQTFFSFLKPDPSIEEEQTLSNNKTVSLLFCPDIGLRIWSSKGAVKNSLTISAKSITYRLNLYLTITVSKRSISR